MLLLKSLETEQNRCDSLKENNMASAAGRSAKFPLRTNVSIDPAFMDISSPHRSNGVVDGDQVE